MSADPRTIPIRLNSQQRAILDRLVESGKYGDTYSSVITHGFREFCQARDGLVFDDAPGEEAQE